MDRIASMTTFTTVVTSGSFSAAAQRLNISPAMVSTHVRSLEERLGARLLNRTTRKLSLTEVGQAYYQSCAEILAQIEQADNRVASLNTTPRGTLRVNASSYISYLLVSFFDAFGEAYPEITIELVTTDRMPDLVEEGIDLAIRMPQPPDSSLIVRQLARLRMILSAAPAYLAKQGAPREPADLAHHNCLSYMHPGFTALTREWHLNGPKGKVKVPISGNLHTNCIDILRSAVFGGRGIMVSPEALIDAGARLGLLVHVLPDYHVGEWPIVVLYPNRQHLPAKVRTFIDFAVKHFAEELKRSLEARIAAAPRVERLKRVQAKMRGEEPPPTPVADAGGSKRKRRR
jgi:DNA-binding transcriptional LysR family regulator